MMETRVKPLKRMNNRPQFIIICIAAMAIVLNVAALLLFVIPAHFNLKDVQQLEEQKAAEFETAQQQFTAEQISDEKIGDLLKKVPVERIDSDHLIFLHDLSDVSKSPLAYVRQPQEMEENGEAAVSEVVVSNFEVLILGHLENLLLYMDNLQQYERLYAIKSWSLKEVDNDSINKDYPDLFTNRPYMVKTKPVLALNLKIESYILPQFSETFNKVNQAER